MANKPLMPKATAVWLVENTALTFEQIADFCGLHPLEVTGIADGDVAQGIKGFDPVANGQLSREEIEKAQDNPSHRLVMTKQRVVLQETKRKGPRYTPVSRRQDRPDAIMWLVRHHPELTDAQISKLIGTTKPTIQAVRERTHWNSANLKPVDPVTLGLCSQLDLDAVVQKAAEKRAKDPEYQRLRAEAEEALKPIDETLGADDQLSGEKAPVFDPAVFGTDSETRNPEPSGAEIDHDPAKVFGDK